MERGTDDGWDLGYGDKRKVEGQGVCVCVCVCVRTDGTGSTGWCWLVCGGWRDGTQARTGRPPSHHSPPVRTSQSVRPVVSRFALQARGYDAKGNDGWLRAGVRSARVCEAIDAPSA